MDTVDGHNYLQLNVMKAKIKENILELYDAVLPNERDRETTDFLLSIEGREVDLVFTLGDAFEKEDNNYWLPSELWDEVS